MWIFIGSINDLKSSLIYVFGFLNYTSSFIERLEKFGIFLLGYFDKHLVSMTILISDLNAIKNTVNLNNLKFIDKMIFLFTIAEGLLFNDST